jgi:hypothetical protein
LECGQLGAVGEVIPDVAFDQSPMRHSVSGIEFRQFPNGVDQGVECRSIIGAESRDPNGTRTSRAYGSSFGRAEQEFSLTTDWRSIADAMIECGTKPQLGHQPPQHSECDHFHCLGR